MTQPTSIRSVKLLADLAERGDAVIPPGDDAPGVVSLIKRARKRLSVAVTIELEDGRSFTIGANKFVRQAVVPAA